MKIFRKILIILLAKKIYLALISNSARYTYISSLSQEKSNKQLNDKNVYKAFKMAESFWDYKY